MNNHLEVLRTNELFKNIETDDIKSLLTCLGAKNQTYKKDEILILVDTKITCIGVVLSGSIQIIKEDIDGMRTINAELSGGEIFAETFACSGIEKSPVTVITPTGCEIMYIEFKKIITTCSSSCKFHSKLISNMLTLISNKNLKLNSKLDLLSLRTTRERILSYLSMQSRKAGSRYFLIPFSRNELADFLCVDRSALSRELSKLQKEGAFEFHKNEFKLKEN